MAITAFGRFFSWEDCLYFPGWKSGGDSNYLRILGHQKTKSASYRNPETKPEADFTRASGIYLLQNKEFQTVYVGQAKSLGARLQSHTGDHLRNRWTHFSFFAINIPADPATAEPIHSNEIENDDTVNLPGELSLNLLEAILRTSMEPILNLQGGRWGDVSEYAQSVEYEWIYRREIFEQNEKALKKLKKLGKLLKS